MPLDIYHVIKSLAVLCGTGIVCIKFLCLSYYQQLWPHRAKASALVHFEESTKWYTIASRLHIYRWIFNSIAQKIADFNNYSLSYHLWKLLYKCGPGKQWRIVWWICQSARKRTLLHGEVIIVLPSWWISLSLKWPMISWCLHISYYN